MKKELIKYFRSLGIEVYTNTKARGHQGFFLDNRIDISKDTDEERIVPTLLHEFAHFIHKKVEPEMVKTGGSIDVLFGFLPTSEQKNVEKEKPAKMNPIGCFFSNLIGARQIKLQLQEDNDDAKRMSDAERQEILQELLAVTHFVDKNSHLTKLHEHKEQVKKKIKSVEAEIKSDYPNFMRSKKFKEFDKYIKKSNARYLLKYDRVKFITPFLGREEFYSIDNLENDFPDMPKAFSCYLILKSCMRKQARVSNRLNRLNKYYSKPTELFARFVEGLYIDEAQTRAFAPQSTKMFFKLLEEDYYFELRTVFEMLNKELVSP